MARLRTLLLRSPGVTALATMLALVTIAWATPEVNTHVHASQSRPLA